MKDALSNQKDFEGRRQEIYNFFLLGMIHLIICWVYSLRDMRKCMI